jgi:tripartite-type tricarboxylate transporter receptor subunit TctC
MKIRFRIAMAAIAGVFLLAPSAAFAQDFPIRVIRIIVPFAPGGGTDVFARVLAVRLQEALGQSMVVDNRPGAGSNIGTELTVKSPPDGYTLMFTTTAVAVNVTLYPKLPFDAR